MQPRHLAGAIEALCFADHKMALVSGPRPCGKTTMAKMLLSGASRGGYHNWDDVVFRRAWSKDPSSVIPAPGKVATRVVLDEIHKERRWKRALKGLYDLADPKPDILVTGSARLDLFRKGSDILLGRCFHFRLHPFSVGELLSKTAPDPNSLLEHLAHRRGRHAKVSVKHFFNILRFGTFPEPLLGEYEIKAKLRRRTRTQQVLREDLRI